MAEKLCSFLFYYFEFRVNLFLTREKWLVLNLYSCYVKSGVKEWRSPSSEMSVAPSSRSFEMNSAHFVLSVMEWAGEVSNAPTFTPSKWIALLCILLWIE